MIQLIHGDCLEEMKKIADGSIDLVLTDPPYGTTACKWDTVIPFEPMWKQLKRVTKKNGAIVLFGSQPFTSALVMSNPKMFKYEWVWNKSKAVGYLNSKIMPMVAHENILVFSVGKTTYNPQKTTGHKAYNKGKAYRPTDVYGSQKEVLVRNDDGTRYPRTVQYFTTAESEGKLHPTQKPVALMEYLIKTYTNENETVLDFTMGSGTTGVACKNLNRNFIGIELDANYYEIAKKRICEA
jgi:DNA modification methylase